MTDSNSLADQARGLREDVGGLAAAVKTLAERTEQSDRTVAALRRITVGLVACLVAGMIVAAYSVVLSHRLETFTRCQATYNASYDAALLQRTRALTDATADERAAERARTDAFDALFTDPAVNRPPGQTTEEDRKTIQRLYAVYLKAAKELKAQRAAADAARAANPVPVQPERDC